MQISDLRGKRPTTPQGGVVAAKEREGTRPSPTLGPEVAAAAIDFLRGRK